MNKTVTGLCVAAAFGLAATLGAQPPTTTTASTGDREVTISGCLSKAAAGGYTLTNARVEPNASASTTTAPGSTTTTAGATSTAAGSPTTTAGATTTAGTSGTAGAAASPAMTWMLSGDSELEKHVGHKIQVTGKTSWSGSSSPSASTSTTTTSSSTTTAGGAGNQPSLDVKSIKMVSTSCS
jgi:hypothetical protein